MPEYVVEETLTKTILKLAIGVPAHVKILSKFYTDPATSRKLEALGKKQASEKDADLLDVLDLDNPAANEDAPQYITVNKILKDVLETSFPKGDYVGKCFRITKGAKTGGGARQYNPMDIQVIKVKK